MLPPKITRRIQEGPKGGRRHQHIKCLANLPETLTLEFILAETCEQCQEGLLSQTKYVNKQDDWPETTQKDNPVTLKPEIVNHMAEQLSWVPSLYSSLIKYVFAIKSFTLSVYVSPWTIHF